MQTAPALAHVWRGDFLECVHRGHAVIADATGQVVEAWGDPDLTLLPRSSTKMIQALPLLDSGAADARGLTPEHLALACASHEGDRMHTDRVTRWLADLGLSDDALRCGGPQPPRPKDIRHEMIRTGESPCQVHNNCSGKHTGFLTLGAHLGAGPEYIDIDHPVQRAVKTAFEEVTGEDSPGFGIDGCSAPNFATSLKGLARAMAFFATAEKRSDARSAAALRLTQAMIAHPELVAGTGRACTELMQAMDGRAAIKTGAEGVFVAILPDRGLGIALKIEDGATRGAECALAALLARVGVLDPAHPAAQKRLNAPITNWRGVHTGRICPADDLLPGS